MTKQRCGHAPLWNCGLAYVLRTRFLRSFTGRRKGVFPTVYTVCYCLHLAPANWGPHEMLTARCSLSGLAADRNIRIPHVVALLLLLLPSGAAVVAGDDIRTAQPSSRWRTTQRPATSSGAPSTQQFAADEVFLLRPLLDVRYNTILYCEVADRIR